MKQFITRLILTILPVVLLIPAVNYYVDPAHVYSYKEYEKGIVSALQSHKYVTNVDANHNERYFKKVLIDSCKTREINFLILGSSRIMLISDDMLGDAIVLNLGVSGATYEDITALCYYYIKKYGFPRKVLIGIDPQHFNENIGDSRWTELTKEYNDYKRDVLKDSTVLSANDNKISNLFSPSYFQSAIKYLWKNSFHLEGQIPIQAVDIADGIKVVCRDGSILYDREYTNRSLEMVNKEALSLEYGQWESFNDLSQNEIVRWKCFIEYLQSNGIQIYFQEAAFHPITYQRFLNEPKYKGMVLAMDYVNELANMYDIPILGAYNPTKYGLNSSDFYDGMHMKLETESLYLRPLIKYEKGVN